MRLLRSIRPASLLVVLALLTFGVAHPASAQAPGAQLTVTGGDKVKIDGLDAVSGSTVFTGSRVTTTSGVTAQIMSAGSRVTIQPETDATVVFAGSFMRVDVICGVANGDPAPGAAFELITHGDTSVFVASGAVQVEAEGKMTNLAANQTQTFEDGVHIRTTGASSFEASTLLCSCLCAAPVIFPVIAVPFPVALVALLIGGGAAAVAVPIIIHNDNPQIIVSNPFPA
ncbi:MAG TPA: hypothetical protein PLF26_07785 [Blastocatellia bacterium]|nr:hypothetical protein [Blastocatellia bacterium]